ncbi:hypothetical protein [Pontibacter actiniarum]|uniref:Uncharacterized protein n=1 Tax=Pontibacter actiniarum TaxID=323450 RepID=A0A1X9YQJ5_9BACT|nr:hypothetical protein [Pontibacter actiniarum]ARS35147.1 hypothetical protein CA264_06640 [Pontibacter actiniarum]
MNNLTFEDFTTNYDYANSLLGLTNTFNLDHINELRSGLKDINFFIQRCQILLKAFEAEKKEIEKIKLLSLSGQIDEANSIIKEYLIQIDHELTYCDMQNLKSKENVDEFLTEYLTLIEQHADFISIKLAKLDTKLRPLKDHLSFLAEHEKVQNIRVTDLGDREAQVYRAFRRGYEDSLGF